MKIIENKDFENASDGRDRVLEITEDTFLRNVNIYVSDTKPTSSTGLCGIYAHGFNLLKTENVKIIPVGPMKRKYIFAIRAGTAAVPGDSVQFMEHDRLVIGDFGPPATDYTTNHDAISIEGGQRTRFKDCIFHGAGDGIFDSKMPLLEAARCQFGPSHRQIRQWPGVKATFSECSFNTPATNLWHQDASAQTTLYKPTFNKPIQTENENGMGQVLTVTSDPITDPWFKPGPAPDKLRELLSGIHQALGNYLA